MSLREKIESSIDIVELVSKYTKLKKAGANYKAVCPFPGHNEKTPSFVVSPVKQLGYCFGCHKGGGPIKFVMDIENCNYSEALEILAPMAGIEYFARDKEKDEVQKGMYTIYKDAANYYSRALDNYDEVKKYLQDRGLTDELIKEFGLGYSDNSLELYRYLKSKGYDDKLMKESGIFIDTINKKDKFLGRVIFSIKNLRGEVVAFAGRILGKGEPKYLNSPATDIYDKSSILYGLYEAKKTVVEKDYIIITEGYMDTISLHKAGIKNSVCVSGTALTDKHIPIIKRLTHKIYLCFDNDKAGEQATFQSIENLKNNDLEIKIILLEGGKDPDEIIKAGINFEELISKAVSPIGFYFEKLKNKFGTSSLDEKKKLLKELLEVLKSYTDKLEIDYYLKEIAKKLDISLDIVYSSFSKIRGGKKVDDITSKISLSSQDYLIGAILHDDSFISVFTDGIIFRDYISANLKGLLDKGEKALDSIELEKKELYRGVSLEIGESLESGDKDRKLKDILYKYNLDSYNKIKKELNKKLEETGDDSILLEIMKIDKVAKENRLK